MGIHCARRTERQPHHHGIASVSECFGYCTERPIPGPTRFDLEKSNIRLEFCCGALIDWGHCLAMSAPIRPEVDEHRNVIVLEVRL
jgi:hypothetical protein